MKPWVRRAVVFAVTVGASVVTFAILLRLLRPGWASREHAAILVWSLPLGMLVLAGALPLRRFLRKQSAALRALAVLLGGAVVAILWTVAAVALTGGYALAFDANPLWCWYVGSVAGLSASLFWRDIPGRSGTSIDAPAT
jgi:hypothetical protein